jgi:hypothetical protein
LLSGCVSYEKTTQVTRTQNPTGEALFDQIHLNETSQAWLLATLGNPQEISHLESGATVFRYENLHTKRTQFQFLPAISWQTQQLQATSYWFEIQQERIVRCWSSKS